MNREELDHFFLQHHNDFRTRDGMHVIRNGNGIHTYTPSSILLPDEEIHEHTFQTGVQTSGDSEEEFITHFRLGTLADIDRLSYNHGWIRYLNGSAEMLINVIYLEVDLHFLIQKNKTMIFCTELHFYDEVTRHLTLAEEAENYVIQNMWKLHACIARLNQ